MADDPVTVKVRGFPELLAGSRELFDNIADAAPDAFADVADDVRAAVQARVPRRSGALAATVTSSRVRDGASVGYSGGVPYDGWIDFGGTRGRPYVGRGRFLFPAAFDAERQLIDAAEETALDEIGDMRWPKP